MAAFPYPPNSTTYDPTSLYNVKEQTRMGRTPSPTPSENKAMKSGVLDWKSMTNWRFWFRREWLWYYAALVIILVLTGLMTIYHSQIVNWLTPATRWLHDLKVGWLVPIAVLFVISFPPEWSCVGISRKSRVAKNFKLLPVPVNSVHCSSCD